VKNRLILAFVAILSAVPPMFPGGANGASNNFLNALFTNTDSSMCKRTEAFIFAHGGKLDSSPAIFIKVIQSNDCMEQLTMDASGSVKVNASSIIFDEHSKSAAVNTTVRVVDKISKRTIPLRISMNWVGVGNPVHTHDDFYFQCPGTIACDRKHFTAVHCSAQASGGIYRGNANLSPQNAEDAEIVWFTNGE